MKKQLYALLLRVRNRHLFLLDVAILLLVPSASLFLRLERIEIVAAFVAPLLVYTLTSLFLKLSVFNLFGFYRRYWCYASVDEIALLCSGTLTSWIVCAVVFLAVLKPAGFLPNDFPKSIPLIDGVLTMLMVGGVRFGLRLVFVLNERIDKGVTRRNVLIVGAGNAGSMIVKELRANPHLGMNPVAFVDDDPAKLRMNIHGVEVMGTLDHIPEIVTRKGVAEIIIAIPTAPGKVIRHVLRMSEALKVPSKTIPGIFEILAGSAVSQLRDVRIDDLLRRGTVQIDSVNVRKLIEGTRVMVTGAGGSIGSELCRQIAGFGPSELVMLGHGEDSIFRITNELKSRHGVDGPAMRIRFVIADIRDRERMNHVLAECQPQIIFHAAAHKHVGLMEVNCPDAVTNNVLGTKILTELAALHCVDKLVMISSDKAVCPTSVMGVTKRIAEQVVYDVAVRNRRDFVVVRFGNVLGSRGSVVPILKKQIQAGGPVTITHPDASRFFMTIPEAVQLVLQAGAMGSCGETYVLDMGQPIRIVDLAHDLIRLSGLVEGRDIDIVFTGLQGGEKMHEELFYPYERAELSTHEKIFVCRNGHGDEGKKALLGIASLDHGIDGEATIDEQMDTFRRNIERLVMWAEKGAAENTRELLQKIVPEYHNLIGPGMLLTPAGENGERENTPVRFLSASRSA